MLQRILFVPLGKKHFIRFSFETRICHQWMTFKCGFVTIKYNTDIKHLFLLAKESLCSSLFLPSPYLEMRDRRIYDDFFLSLDVSLAARCRSELQVGPFQNNPCSEHC